MPDALGPATTDFAVLSGHFEDCAPQEILSWAFSEFPGDTIALACSFGAEDVVLAHMISRIRPGARVFYLDTDLLFPETYATRDRIAGTYTLHLERVSPPVSLAEQAAAYGEALWEKQPDLCCNLRKVEPLRRVLSTLDCWITGIRRDQAPSRAQAPSVEWDAKFGLVKVNPLVRWNSTMVWDYIHAHNVPYNPLHDAGYPSIGCTHCTRPVAADEDPRAGRWAGLDKTECGLHQ